MDEQTISWLADETKKSLAFLCGSIFVEALLLACVSVYTIMVSTAVWAFPVLAAAAFVGAALAIGSAIMFWQIRSS